MKCLTMAMVPWLWMPEISPAPVCPVSSGSSPKVLKARAQAGSRSMLTNGSSTTSTPSARASRPITTPLT